MANYIAKSASDESVMIYICRTDDIMTLYPSMSVILCRNCHVKKPLHCKGLGYTTFAYIRDFSFPKSVRSIEGTCIHGGRVDAHDYFPGIAPSDAT